MQQSSPGLTALALDRQPNMRIVPAPATREWMNATDERFANRCLPLRIANQAGWFLLSNHRFRVWWDGSDHPDGVRILYFEGEPPYPATSIFGSGILTFHIPYLFRTTSGYNLLARGPANTPKDGITALEGIVETDWTVATFTMNWCMTRAEHLVEFSVNDPVCMIVPQKRGELEAFSPLLRAFAPDEAAISAFEAWNESRNLFRSLLHQGRFASQDGWQKHYFFGTSPGDGPTAPAHQLRLQLKPFGRG